jgi:transposase-like protein
MEAGSSTRQSIHAVGITMDGIKKVLGMWTSENQGAKFLKKGHKQHSP